MNEPVLDREVRRRLAVLRHVEEVTGNVATTCRYFGISRPTYYAWLHRYEKEGVDGLPDRSKRPRTSPNATRAELAAAAVNGRKGGCPRVVDDAAATKARNLREKAVAATDIAKMLGVSRATVYRYLASDGSLSRLTRSSEFQ